MTLRRFMFFVPIVALAIAAGLSASAGGARASADPDYDQNVRDFVEALNAPRDLDAVAALVADNVIVTDIGRDSFAVVGEEAFVAILASEDADGFESQTNISTIDVDGNVASGKVRTSSTTTEEAGVDRFIQLFTITFNDAGLISRVDLTYDETDNQTRKYLDFLEEGEGGGGDGELPEGTIEVALAAQPGGNQPGVAYILPGAAPGTSTVVVVIEGGAEDVLQPAHFHTGSCAAPGPVVYPLASVLNGDSFTGLSASPEDIAAQNLIINVHKSAGEITQYVSCGAVGGAAASPTAAPALTATPTPRPGIAAPDTGSGTSGSGDPANPALVAALVAGSIALAGTGMLRLRRR